VCTWGGARKVKMKGKGREEGREGEERREEGRSIGNIQFVYFVIARLNIVPSALFLKHLCAAYPIFTSSLKDKRLTFSLVSLVHKITCTTLSRIEP